MGGAAQDVRDFKENRRREKKMEKPYVVFYITSAGRRLLPHVGYSIAHCLATTVVVRRYILIYLPVHFI